ncbi:MAG TPA: DUF885 domain-containing protein [Clostridiales bacterium]|nr:DUF885 domain-containing protein [Clostridiales bacterium]
MFSKRLKFLLLILLGTLSIISGCHKKDDILQQRSDFDNFINEIFVDSVQSDTLTLSYSLADPESFGIFIDEITLGEYSFTKMKEGMLNIEKYLSALNDFKYELLEEEQQLIYSILEKYLVQELEFGNYLYYKECLGPTTGIQAQLPILLAEYSFYDRSDIDDYINLLSCVDDYFSSIATFEKEKAAQGLFMRDEVADSIISQCEAFISFPEDNFLIDYFDDKIDNYDYLTERDKALYKSANKEAVLNYVIPAYENLIAVLYDLKGSGTNDAGLYYYPDGKEYYELLAKKKTGSTKSVKEMASFLEEAIKEETSKIVSLSLSDPHILDKYMDFSSFPITEPDEILDNLKHKITVDFPNAIPVSCDIKYVHKSLSEYLSPAMYLVPPMDNYTKNNIYINGRDEETLSTIYTTIAHEGYPGHLYQCVYFRDQNPAPIRNIMDFVGYDEGWATYVEMYSYSLSGIDKNLASFLEANSIIILCMYARADIGIHYEGWKEAEVVEYISNFINSEAVGELIYKTLLEEPAIYLPYAVGFLEIRELREKAEVSLGASFYPKDFHRFLLDIGPSQFEIIDNRLDLWIKDQAMAKITIFE